MKKILKSKKPIKSEVLKNLEDSLKKSTSHAFIEYKGLDANLVNELRAKLRQEQASVVVAKNTLIKKAFGDGKVLEDMDGQTAVVFSFGDSISPVKVLFEYAKKVEKLVVKGLYLEERLYGKDKVEEISKIPSKEVLIGRFVGSLKSPLYGFSNVLSGTQRKLVFALSAVAKTKEVSQ